VKIVEIDNCDKSFLKFLFAMPRLNQLKLSNCDNLEEICGDDYSFLEHIEIQACKKFTKIIPSNVLKMLKIINCGNFTKIEVPPIYLPENRHYDHVPVAYSQLSKLISLTIECKNFETLPDLGENVGERLQTIDIKSDMFKNLPESISQLKFLKNLYIESNAFKKLPENMSNLSNLNDLTIDSELFESLPILKLNCLATISLKNSNVLDKIPNALHCSNLVLQNCKNFKAIGNAVNSEVILNISKNLILNENYES